LACVAFLASSTKIHADDSDLKRGVDNKPLTGPNPKYLEIREALCLGTFAADTVDAAMQKSFFDEASAKPMEGDTTANLKWILYSSDRERFVVSLIPLTQSGSCFATYFSFWIYTPSAVSPDQNLNFLYYVSTTAKLWLNGKPYEPGTTEPSDAGTRTLYHFPNMALQTGWNHFLIKVAGKASGGGDPADPISSLAIRIACADTDLAKQLIISPAVKPVQQ